MARISFSALEKSTGAYGFFFPSACCRSSSLQATASTGRQTAAPIALQAAAPTAAALRCSGLAGAVRALRVSAALPASLRLYGLPRPGAKAKQIGVPGLWGRRGGK